MSAHRRAAERMGVKVRSGTRPPSIPPRMLQEWSAFTALSRRRPVGFSVGAIPVGEIRGWLDEMGVHDRDEREDFLTVIEALDAEFMRVQNEKAKARQ